MRNIMFMDICLLTAAGILLAVQDMTPSTNAPGYTAGEVLTIIAALGVLITGAGAVIVNIIVALKTGAKIDVAAAKTDGLVAQVNEVHNLTNSGLTAVKAELTLSNTLNAQLRDIIADLKEERSKTALIAAHKSLPSIEAVKGGNEEGETAEHLEQIEINTAETAENTAQTEQSTKRTEKDIKEKLPKRRE